MFEDGAPRVIKKPKKSFFSWPVILAIVIASLVIAIVALAIRIYGTPVAKVPSAIAQQVSHPIFLPRNLPSGYKIVEDSFTYSEEALVFRAEDSAGTAIVFTEQKRPKDFNFERFYAGQMENAKTLSGTPYPSVTGKSPTGSRQLLSIVTEETWILASIGAPLDDNDLAKIAKGIKKY